MRRRAEARAQPANLEEVEVKRRILALLTGATLLLTGGTAMADLVGLPANGLQVNNDPAAGIDPNQNAGLSDVVGGSLAPGGARVPWAACEQQSGSSQQMFSRASRTASG